MQGRIAKLQDSIGNPYLGVKVPFYTILLYLEKFEVIINSNNELYILELNRFKRDGENYHITWINSMDFKNIEASSFINKEVAFDILGIGKAEKNNNKAYFLVVDCPILNSWRNELGLANIDLHITLGFDKKDVFGVSKGVDSLIKN